MVDLPLHSLLGGVFGPVAVLALAVASLVLLFAGRSIIKVVAFFVVGLVGAVLGGAVGAVVLGPLGALIGALLGFIVGGLVGVTLLALGIGLIIGYAGYILALDLSASFLVALIVGFVLFIVGLALHNKLLSVVTAVAGGILLYDVLRILGLEVLVSAIIAGLAVLAGIYVQNSTSKKMVKPVGSTSTPKSS